MSLIQVLQNRSKAALHQCTFVLESQSSIWARSFSFLQRFPISNIVQCKEPKPNSHSKAHIKQGAQKVSMQDLGMEVSLSLKVSLSLLTEAAAREAAWRQRV